MWRGRLCYGTGKREGGGKTGSHGRRGGDKGGFDLELGGDGMVGEMAGRGVVGRIVKSLHIISNSHFVKVIGWKTLNKNTRYNGPNHIKSTFYHPL